MALHAFIGGIGGPELLIVLFIAVFLFGANKLPKLARSSGQAMGEFQKGRQSLEREIEDATAPITDPVPGSDSRQTADVSNSATTDRTTDESTTDESTTDESTTDGSKDPATTDAVETESDN
jgi:sec-independent protein translocase protein TatA